MESDSPARPPTATATATATADRVDGEETTYVSSATDRPTDLDRPTEYYAYRLTRPHLDWVIIRPIVERYSKSWCVGLHFPDTLEDECEKEHYHFVFCDFDKKKVDTFKKAIALQFNAKGNGLHAGRFRDNHVSHAIGYMKHDELCVFYHDPDPRWKKFISDTPAFEKRAELARKKKEKLSDPILTYSNLLKQAKLYRDTHMADSNSLQNVLSRMVNQSNWVLSRELVTNGVPRELHEMFVDRCAKTSRSYTWMQPHRSSDDKLKWLPVVDGHPIAGMVANCAAPPVYKGV